MSKLQNFKSGVIRRADSRIISVRELYHLKAIIRIFVIYLQTKLHNAAINYLLWSSCVIRGTELSMNVR
jgi:hypothetical protein